MAMVHTVPDDAERSARCFGDASINTPVIVTRINWFRVALVALATASVAVLVADRFRAATSRTADVMAREPRPADQAFATARRHAPTLRVTAQTVPGRPGHRLPLGISIHGPRAGAAVEITGLPPGSSLSSGRPFGENGWRIADPRLSAVLIRPPPEFVGAIDLAVELRRADDTLVERRSARRTWSPPASVKTSSPQGPAVDVQTTGATTVPASSANDGTSQAAAPGSGEPDAEQIALFMRRGEELLSTGDLFGARLVLERAARAGNVRAALLLGGTYDQILPSQLGAGRNATDQAKARAWYERAKELGSSEARQRLDALTRSQPGSELPSRP
jgi:hypothetical protein